ncbi:hypothetical protein Salat_2701900 [Sesamum alatum]|uniref:Myb/SANT-like domain-containing protein n=1 Tax=Sesamum alatum TaxID=300844 RepID=A0AAE1XQ07_9LAMI|nr:hypothetical protein Salat_2701900 [Sesamum alatum]
MMWPNGYYYQWSQLYTTRWTKEMERTFVLALVEQARAGRFRSGRRNRDALDFAIGEVNRVHGSRVAESWGEIRIVSLRDRYIVSTWLINLDEVICNRNLRYVIAPDHVWKRVCKEKKLAKCYINAFEDLYNALCVLFGPENALENEGPIDLNAPPPEPVDGDASQSYHTSLGIDLYSSDSDANFVLPPPGVPRSIVKRSPVLPPSLPSYHSPSGASSPASNATPIKRRK